MAHVDVRDVLPAPDCPTHRLMNWTEGRTPSNDGQLRDFAPDANVLIGNGIGDTHHLGGARVGHLLVRRGRVIDVAGAGLLLNPADAVFEARRPGLDPRTSKPVTARERHDALPFRRRSVEELHREWLV